MVQTLPLWLLLPWLAPLATAQSSAADLPTPTDLSTAWTYAGCFTDPVPTGNASAPLHALTDDYWYNLDLTQVRCATFCQQGGWGMAGLEYATQCTCGNTLRSSAVETTEDECDNACSGNSAIKCGGAYRMNLFVNTALLMAASSSSSASVAAQTSSSAAAVSEASSSSSLSSSVAAAETSTVLSSMAELSSTSSSITTTSSPTASSTLAPTSSVALASYSSVVAASSSSVAAAAAAAAAAEKSAAAAGSAANKSGGGGLSGGAIAGIVVGVVVGAALFAVLVFFLCRRRRRQDRSARRSSGIFGGIARPLSGLHEKPADGRGGGGVSNEKGRNDGSGGMSSSEGMDDDDNGVLDISGAHSLEEHNLALPPLSTQDDAALHPHAMPYQLGPVAHPSPLLGSRGSDLMVDGASQLWDDLPVHDSPPSPAKQQPHETEKTHDLHQPTGLPYASGDAFSTAQTHDSPPPSASVSATATSPSDRRLSELSNATTSAPSSWERRQSASSTAALMGLQGPVSPVGRRTSELSASSTTHPPVARSGSVSLSLRKPVPMLVDGDATALEQEQYYNRPGNGSQTSLASLPRRRSFGASEVLKDPNPEPGTISLEDGRESQGPPPDLFKGWDARQMRALDVDRPTDQQQ